MSNYELLKMEIENSGMTMTAIAKKKTGISRGTLYNKINKIESFTASEIVSLSDTLHMSKEKRDKIF